MNARIWSGPGGAAGSAEDEYLRAYGYGSSSTAQANANANIQSTTPPKANAAPKVSKNVAIGLVSALNNQEAEMVKSGTFKIANIYSIEFAPAILGDSLVAKGGTPSKSKTPMQRSKNPSDKVNPKSNSVAYDVRTFEIVAGTPIVAVLDEILKNSSYITDQANVIIDEPTQETKHKSHWAIWHGIKSQFKLYQLRLILGVTILPTILNMSSVLTASMI